ncbi:MAG: TraB/GumN family protein [Helicobacteraceae bacterium]|jgi:uncharacterized protein YbaP (TraB family)|nr:TraB/GumN family protein [Helicobacteraceae bacterium]
MRLIRVLSIFATAFLLFAPFAIAKTSVETTARYPFYLAERGGAKIYILGSMHLGKPKAALSGEIIDAFNRSSKLVMELSVKDMRRADEVVKKYICLDDCLRGQISKKAFETLERDYSELSGYIAKFPAWLAATMLSTMDYMREGFFPYCGVESLLLNERGKIPVIGLETAEEQFDALAALSIKSQKESLEDYLNLSAIERAKTINDTYQAYLIGDADALFKWYMTYDEQERFSLSATEEFNKKLIFDRNKRLTERLLKQVDYEKPIFVTIGALHLGGDKGVLELLRKEGYRIKRL